MAGATAGAITGVATTPLDVIKTRLMTQGRKRTYTGVVDCARKVWADEGPAAFLKVCAGDMLPFCDRLAAPAVLQGACDVWQDGVAWHAVPLLTEGAGEWADSCVVGIHVIGSPPFYAPCWLQGTHMLSMLIYALAGSAVNSALVSDTWPAGQGWQARVLWISLGGCVFFTALEEAQKKFAVKDPSKYQT